MIFLNSASSLGTPAQWWYEQSGQSGLTLTSSPRWMISLFSLLFIIPIAITSAVLCCDFKLDSKPPMETLNSWGCTSPWRIILETLSKWLHIGNYLESCKPDLNLFNLCPSHQEQLTCGLPGMLRYWMNYFFFRFNIDAMTVYFPETKSTNSQIFLLLFLTAILDHYPTGWKSYNMSTLWMFLIFHTVNFQKERKKKWRQSHLTFTLFHQ